MKTILASIFLFLCMNLYSQSYPTLSVDSLGQEVVIMTVTQAQKLDNNSDLLLLFKKLNIQIGGYDSICVQVINDMDSVIAIQKITISQLNERTSIKNEEIENLQKKIELLGKIEIDSEKQLVLKDNIIKETKKKVRNRTIIVISEAILIVVILVFK